MLKFLAFIKVKYLDTFEIHFLNLFLETIISASFRYEYYILLGGNILDPGLIKFIVI